MPVMDGFSLCREWMKDAGLRTVPFVFYSSTYHAAEDEALALALGAVRFLRKPMEPVSFLLEIDRVFDAAKAGKLPPPKRPGCIARSSRTSPPISSAQRVWNWRFRPPRAPGSPWTFQFLA